MADDDVRRFDEPRPVMVRHDDGSWHTGWCEGWVRWPDGWRASVTYSVGMGQKHVRVLPADRVDPIDE